MAPFSGCLGEKEKDVDSGLEDLEGRVEIGPYDKVGFLIDMNGKLAFEAVKDGKTFIVYDGWEIGREYDSASLPWYVNGKLAFVAKKEGKTFIVFKSMASLHILP
jgi:hypothetical protein